MHADSVDAKYKLGHKRCVKTVFLSKGFHSRLKGHDVVRSGQSVGVSEINFMLAGCNFIVACFNQTSFSQGPCRSRGACSHRGQEDQGQSSRLRQRLLWWGGPAHRSGKGRTHMRVRH